MEIKAERWDQFFKFEQLVEAIRNLRAAPAARPQLQEFRILRRCGR